MTEHEISSDDGFAEALWVSLLCECQICGEVLFLDAIEDLLDDDTMGWSEAAAVEARRLGWRYHAGKVECQACSAKSV